MAEHDTVTVTEAARRKRPETVAESLSRPSTIGMYTGPLKVTSDEVDEYLAKHWKP